MSFDKAKTVRAAEKFLAQNKIPQAIEEYTRIVGQEPNDVQILNTLGDLHARVKNSSDAVRCFTQVAEHYRKQGFALKAIAMYKKIHRLDLNNLDVAMHLAALYEQQGLHAEARAQHLVVAEAHIHAGKMRDALVALQRISDLDPQNPDVALRVADIYKREGMAGEAARSFGEAGARLLARKDYERSLAAYTTSLELYPGNKTALEGLIFAHSELGTADEAVEMLEGLAAQSPQDGELLAMLTRAAINAEDIERAERAAAELFEREPSSFPLFAEIARLQMRHDDTDGAVASLARVVEPMLSAHYEEELMELLNEVLARNPEHLEALRLLARIHTWQREDDQLRLVLERLIELVAAANLEDEERNILIQLVRLAPDESRFPERLRELGSSYDTFTVPASDATTATFGGDVSDTPPSDEVPTFESFMLPGDELVANDTATNLTEAAEASTTGAVEFEWNNNESSAGAAASFADLNVDLNAVDPTAIEFGSEASIAGTDFQLESNSGFQDVSFDLATAEHDASIGTTDVANANDAGTVQGFDADETREARLRQMLAQELESVDFYLAQGYEDIARDTLDMLEKQYGTQAEIDARRQKMGVATTTTTATISETTSQDAVATDAHVVANNVEPQPESEVEYAGFSRYDIDESLDAAFTDATATPLASSEASAQSVIPSQIETPSPDVTTTDASAAVVNQTQTTTNVSAAIGASDGLMLDEGLAAVFDEFRSAVELDEPHAPADYETHYNLGLAYKDMELNDEAIEEFQKAVNLVAQQDGTPRYLQCCNLLGHCFMQKGMPQLAAMWFRKGLDAPGHTEDEYQALRYELGMAYEQSGDQQRALDVFSEVYGIDVSYRGVADKLRQLKDNSTVS